MANRIDLSKARKKIANQIKDWIINNYPIGSGEFTDLADQIIKACQEQVDRECKACKERVEEQFIERMVAWLEANKTQCRWKDMDATQNPNCVFEHKWQALKAKVEEGKE